MQDQSNSGMFKDYTSYSKSMNNQSAPPMAQPGMQTGMPSQYAPSAPAQSMPPAFTTQTPAFTPTQSDMIPSTVANPYYLAGYLKTQIGKTMRVEFSLGTSGALTDRTGVLEEVGAAYIVLRQIPNNVKFVGDLYSIKFVTIF